MNLPGVKALYAEGGARALERQREEARMQQLQGMDVCKVMKRTIFDLWKVSGVVVAVRPVTSKADRFMKTHIFI